MAVSGKGISAAVRNAVGEWLTDSTIGILYQEYRRSRDPKEASRDPFPQISFTRKIRNSEDWVRTVRRRGFKGWVREYHSKQFASREVMLEVKTNEQDTLIEYVTIRIRGKLVGGGTVKVPSMLVSQKFRNASLDLDTGGFTPFTESQLADLQAEMSNGDAAVYSIMFEERIV